MRLKDSSAKWKVTLENRNNETVYSVTTNDLFSELHFSEQFRVKMFGEAVGFTTSSCSFILSLSSLVKTDIF